ncbi:hypothetical protein P691DRAFT_791923 [Macrolepiota fuliginosa MF-IS2]|uniref:Uncharacterized protein n=1 Tax=Macrolepiota fuliginosa MF-IS2 TaxID=1400762 RepID=A0A9P5X0Q0_9AGAR|nr:hypothetical protein P691DRAFT_791923 [Macrolepiota fuliginosa MF-IS2]
MPPRFGRNGDWSSDCNDEHNDKRDGWFAGGARSGISIQNPNCGDAPGESLVTDLLQRASEGSRPPQEHEPASGFRVFPGGGYALGGDGVPSVNIQSSVLSVRPGQPVELRIDSRQQEPYRSSVGVQGYHGTGQRLGPPVPDPVW